MQALGENSRASSQQNPINVEMETLEDEIIHGSNSEAIRPPNLNMDK